MISRKYNEQMGAYLAKLAQSKQKQTNADRIRAKTDEELASGMLEIMRGWCPKATSECTAGCKECLLEWLKQEAT
jgi:hypothetical protein